MCCHLPVGTRSQSVRLLEAATVHRSCPTGHCLEPSGDMGRGQLVLSAQWPSLHRQSAAAQGLSSHLHMPGWWQFPGALLALLPALLRTGGEWPHLPGLATALLLLPSLPQRPSGSSPRLPTGRGDELTSQSSIWLNMLCVAGKSPTMLTHLQLARKCCYTKGMDGRMAQQSDINWQTLTRRSTLMCTVR